MARSINPVLPIAALGGLGLFFFLSKKSSAATPEGQGAPPGANVPAPLPGTSYTPAPVNKPKPTSELSEAQRLRMAEALGRLRVSPSTGKIEMPCEPDDIRFATQVVGELDAAGFKDAAAALRAYVDEAAKGVKTPSEAAPIAQAGTSAGMTKEQAEYVARVLALERDPNKIGLLINWLKGLPPSAQRDTFIQMAQALALQLEAANVTTDTLDKINQVITSSPEPPDAGSTRIPVTSSSPGLPTSKPPTSVPAPKPPGAISPAPTKPPPNQPTNVPATPVPQPLPQALSQAELTGRQLGAQLLQLQKQYGLKGAKGKEDKKLVAQFQTLTGIKADGVPGPATFILLASKGAVDLPLVYYWFKGSTAATVAEYRSNLEKIATAMEKAGRRDEANTLRVSIAREHGEGGIDGPLYGAAVATAAAPKPTTTAVKPVASSAAVPPPSPNVGPVVVDPYPSFGLTLRKGAKGEAVKRWQQALKTPGTLGKIYDVGAVDGDFGTKSDTMTRAFQKDVGISPVDGIVGPQTRIAARKYGKW
jgi:hypothetical protein